MFRKRISVFLGTFLGAPPVGKYRPETILINEQGLYQLIFSSELKTAKEFRRWDFKDMLPSIRKTGSHRKTTHRSSNTSAQ
jgi:prophage antirepressor-like protein